MVFNLLVEKDDISDSRLFPQSEEKFTCKIKYSRILFYLFSHDSDNISKLLDHEVNAFNAWLFEPPDLFLNDGLERHVWCEEAHSDT